MHSWVVPGRRWLNRHGLFCFLGAVAFVANASGTFANPVPQRDALEMNERPRRWLSRPNAEDERLLVYHFANYGIARGLLSPSTIGMLERNFDHFAPILVAAQRPPHFPHETIQSWYREHADRAQAEAMKGSLMAWLTEPVTKAPIMDNQLVEEPGEVKRMILRARLAAAEALGDWRDPRAVPALRDLQARLPKPSPVITAAIRRITDPQRADILVPRPGGKFAVGLPRGELDSVTVSWRDAVASRWGTWVADAHGTDRIWTALGQAREDRPRNRPHWESDGFFMMDLLSLYFRDGRIGRLERQGGYWALEDNGRINHRLDLVIPPLREALLGELDRAGVAPSMPRFVRESITLSIDPGRLQVVGIYAFEGSPPDGWLSLRYPVAVGNGLGPPRFESVALRSLEERRELKTTWEPHGDGIRIGLETGGARTYELEVRYSQEMSGRSATYLVTTARAWGRPIHQAWFQVVIDSTLGVPRFEWDFRNVPERPGYRRYLYQAVPFQPDKDLVVRW